MFSGRIWPSSALAVDRGQIARALLLVDRGLDPLTDVGARLIEGRAEFIRREGMEPLKRDDLRGVGIR